MLAYLRNQPKNWSKLRALSLRAIKNDEKATTCPGKARSNMRYRVYSGPKGSTDVSPFEKSKLLFKEFASLDDALSWSHHVENSGRVPLLIEGDDGTRMNRRAIIEALRVAMRERL
jgi:hypothetical protein